MEGMISVCKGCKTPRSVQELEVFGGYCFHCDPISPEREESPYQYL